MIYRIYLRLIPDLWLQTECLRVGMQRLSARSDAEHRRADAKELALYRELLRRKGVRL